MHHILILLMALVFASPAWAENNDFMGGIGLGQLGQPGGGQPQPSQPAQGKLTPPPEKATLPARLTARIGGRDSSGTAAISHYRGES